MATPASVDPPVDIVMPLNDNLTFGDITEKSFKGVDSANGSELSDAKESTKGTPNTLDQAVSLSNIGANLPFMGFNPYASLLNKAKLDIEGDLDQIMYSWSSEEQTNRRRLVQFWRRHEHNHIVCGFKPISSAERAQNSIVVSCIYWSEKNDFFITSVDCIYLLEALIGVRFTVEEKNRIRRNLEGFRPLTVSKNKEESAPFFKLIMAFPNPKPRNIEKDVKVFHWRVLAFALKKIIGKYTASYSTTASISLDSFPSSSVTTTSTPGVDAKASIPDCTSSAHGPTTTGMYTGATNPFYVDPLNMMMMNDAVTSTPANGTDGASGAQGLHHQQQLLQQLRMHPAQRRFSTPAFGTTHVNQWLQQQMGGGVGDITSHPMGQPSYLHTCIDPTATTGDAASVPGSGATINPMQLHQLQSQGLAFSPAAMSRYLGANGQTSQPAAGYPHASYDQLLPTAFMGSSSGASMTSPSAMDWSAALGSAWYGGSAHNGGSGSGGNHCMRTNDRFLNVARRHSVADPYNAEYSLQHRRRALQMLQSMGVTNPQQQQQLLASHTSSPTTTAASLLTNAKLSSESTKLTTASASFGGGSEDPFSVPADKYLETLGLMQNEDGGDVGATNSCRTNDTDTNVSGGGLMEDEKFNSAQFEEAMKAALAGNNYELLNENMNAAILGGDDPFTTQTSTATAPVDSALAEPTKADDSKVPAAALTNVTPPPASLPTATSQAKDATAGNQEVTPTVKDGSIVAEAAVMGDLIPEVQASLLQATKMVE